MTMEETRAALVRLGVPPALIEKHVEYQFRGAEPGRSAVTHVEFAPDAPCIALPLRFTLPWSALCSDNERKRPIVVMVKGKPSPRMAMTAEYKAARTKVIDIARDMMHGSPALAMPLAIHARVYVPDERLHDVVNFAKGVNDALEKIIYVNDKWLHRSLWERAGVDVDAPRAEIEISALGDR